MRKSTKIRKELKTAEELKKRGRLTRQNKAGIKLFVRLAEVMQRPPCVFCITPIMPFNDEEGHEVRIPVYCLTDRLQAAIQGIGLTDAEFLEFIQEELMRCCNANNQDYQPKIFEFRYGLGSLFFNASDNDEDILLDFIERGK